MTGGPAYHDGIRNVGDDGIEIAEKIDI